MDNFFDALRTSACSAQFFVPSPSSQRSPPAAGARIREIPPTQGALRASARSHPPASIPSARIVTARRGGIGPRNLRLAGAQDRDLLLRPWASLRSPSTLFERRASHVCALAILSHACRPQRPARAVVGVATRETRVWRRSEGAIISRKSPGHCLGAPQSRQLRARLYAPCKSM
ncbi:hypothetical protein DENSPDRAFT_836888 [Dentipellis sp. KUC8613]|nr:hypothetical protein DENSPDRAFT_836888 [Dentipellis sp. KUC8613]